MILRRTHFLVTTAPFCARVNLLVAISSFRAQSLEAGLAVAIDDAPSFVASIVFYLRGGEERVFSVGG